LCVTVVTIHAGTVFANSFSEAKPRIRIGLSHLFDTFATPKLGLLPVRSLRSLNLNAEPSEMKSRKGFYMYPGQESSSSRVRGNDGREAEDEGETQAWWNKG
jgi:hypothetical protein